MRALPCELSSVRTSSWAALALARCQALAVPWGCSWALPPTQQLHTGSIEAGTFLPACVTGEGGLAPPPQIRKARLPQEKALDASQHIWRSRPYFCCQGVRQMFPPRPGPGLGAVCKG